MSVMSDRSERVIEWASGFLFVVGITGLVLGSLIHAANLLTWGIMQLGGVGWPAGGWALVGLAVVLFGVLALALGYLASGIPRG